MQPYQVKSFAINKEYKLYIFTGGINFDAFKKYLTLSALFQ